jgi:hypothetical protein
VRRWEYRTTYIRFDDPDDDEELCKLGAEGWELVCVTVNYVSIFKRPLVEPTRDSRNQQYLSEGLDMLSAPTEH